MAGLKYYLLVIIVISLVLTLYFTKKLLDNKKLKWYSAVIIVIIILFLGNISGILTDEVIQKPLKKLIFPPIESIAFEPIYHPVIIDGKQKIAIKYENDGEAKLSNIVIDFVYGRGFDNMIQQRAALDSHSLDIGEERYFYFDPPPGDLCSVKPTNIRGVVFMDEENEECYHTFSEVKNVCGIKEINIYFKSKEGLERNFTFFYPALINFEPRFKWPNTTKYCKPIEEAKDDVSKYTPKTIYFKDIYKYPPAFCDNNLLPANYCVKEGYNYSSKPTVEILSDRGLHIIEVEKLKNKTKSSQTASAFPPK